jgi:predicted RNA binding protein YcfA (HicA-like mRNA interferase family)
MSQCGFELKKGSGSARAFVHSHTKQKVRLHEPHPKPTLLRYMVKALVSALKDAGEIT